MIAEIYNNLPSKVDNTASIPVTRKAVNERAHELAWQAGRRDPKVTQIDYERAKREITGETDLDRQNAALDAPNRYKC